MTILIRTKKLFYNTIKINVLDLSKELVLSLCTKNTSYHFESRRKIERKWKGKEQVDIQFHYYEFQYFNVTILKLQSLKNQIAFQCSVNST